VLVRKDVRRTATGQVRFDVPKTASSVRVVALPDPRHLPAAMVYLHARVDRGAQLTQALAIAMAAPQWYGEASLKPSRGGWASGSIVDAE